MGFFNKIKDILFEEVDEEEAKEKVVTQEVKKEAPKQVIAERIEPQRKAEEPKRETVTSYASNEVKGSNTSYDKREDPFSFPDFDEEEFSSSIKPKATTNVMEYEKKKKIEKRYDYGRFERVEKTEVTEKKKFKPSPIISPVYGILNEDYKIEDIKDKTEENKKEIDFNAVRKRAFEDIEPKPVAPKEVFYEESVTVKLKEDEKEREQKAKTIDELLEDTTDEIIHVEEKEINEYNNIDDELEEIEDIKPSEEEVDEDTLENDLFDLIDSMYDNREDGEY